MSNDQPKIEAASSHLLPRLVRLSKQIEWHCFCDEMENSLPALESFLETWGPHCGAPRKVFRGQLCKTILEIWEACEKANQ
jgi:hypothetical protein